MRFLNNFKRYLNLTSEVLSYINRYHSLYKRVIFDNTLENIPEGNILLWDQGVQKSAYSNKRLVP
jgi:hypothetical protein